MSNNNENEAVDAGRVNIWAGSDSMAFDPLHEKSIIYDKRPSDLKNYLDSIEYVADVHLRKSALALMVRNCSITYAREGSGSDGEDFLTNLSTDSTNVYVRISRHADDENSDGVQSFKISNSNEVMARMPCTLSGNFTTQVNKGADTIRVVDEPTLVNSNGSVLASGNLYTSYSNINAGGKDADVYDGNNILASAIPRMLSAQMKGLGSDENILRIIADPEQYTNLLKFSGSGSHVNSSVESLSQKICSNVLPEGNWKTVSAIIQDLETDVPTNEQTRSVQNTPIGVKLLAAIFDQETPTNLNIVPDSIPNSNLNSSNIWLRDDGPDTDTGPEKRDRIRLYDSSRLKNEYVVQFVLRSKLSLLDRSGIEFTRTLKSPDSANGEEDHVDMLINLRFNRDEPLHLTNHGDKMSKGHLDGDNIVPVTTIEDEVAINGATLTVNGASAYNAAAETQHGENAE